MPGDEGGGRVDLLIDLVDPLEQNRNDFPLIQHYPQRDLHTFNDAEVALRARAECLKRLLVSLAFVGRQRDIIAVEFNNDSPQLQSGFVGLNLARGPGQKASAR